MKKLLMVAGVVAALVASSLASGAAEVAVSLTSTGFQPNAPQVNWGDTLVFTNKDSTKHTLLIPRLDVTKDLNPGESYTQLLEVNAGSYQMRDRISNRTFNGRFEVSITGTLTLKASSVSVVYGKPLQLSGVSPYPQAPVILETRPPGQSQWTQLTTVTPGADGSYGAQVSLQRGGRIQAVTAGTQLFSAPVAVTVVPRMTVSIDPRRPADGSTVKIIVKVGPAGAARSASLETYVTLRKRWQKLKTATVGATTGVVRFPVKATLTPTQYRIVIARSGMNPGYVPIMSKPFKITGR